MSETCRECPSRLARKIEDRAISVLCEYDGWILPINMRDCQHVQSQVRLKRTDADEIGDDEELPDGERML